MCPFYNAQLFEITGAAKGVFTHSQSSCHVAKVVLALRHDSRQIPIASDARPFHTSRGFLHWRFAYAGPAMRAAPPSWGRHPQTFTEAELRRPARCSAGRKVRPAKICALGISAQQASGNAAGGFRWLPDHRGTPRLLALRLR